MNNEPSSYGAQSNAHRGGRTPCITFHRLCLDMPRGARLIISRHRGPYWFFHLPAALLTDRRIDQLGDWIVSTPFWRVDGMRPVWKTMRDAWRPYLEWCAVSGIYADIFISRSKIHIDWASAPRRYLGGWRWDTVPPFDEFEQRTLDVVERLAQSSPLDADGVASCITHGAKPI